MDIQEFERRARDPRRTRAELENMKVNAVAKGAVEYARIADEVLRDRFPIKATAHLSGGRVNSVTTRHSTPRLICRKAAARHLGNGVDPRKRFWRTRGVDDAPTASAHVLMPTELWVNSLGDSHIPRV